jgi:hypothetical protein
MTLCSMIPPPGEFTSLIQVGLLPKDNHQQVPFANKMYSREDETG